MSAMAKQGRDAGRIPALLAENSSVLICPACSAALRIFADGNLECSECRASFACEAGIPLLYRSDGQDPGGDVTDQVKSFYEETPFPGYEDIDCDGTLRQKAERGVFARLLDDQIPFGAKVLEVGCGTGQLSNFLGMTWGRTVFASDICLNSLKLGERFRRENRIDNVAFLQMNLFRPVLKSESFDLVICNGVLHHTGDPFRGFESIARLVRPGGHIVIGLYNHLGRLTTDLRRLVFRVAGSHLRWLGERLGDPTVSPTRKNTWFRDQYRNPQESKHSIGEVLAWYDGSGFEFVNSIPKLRAFDSFAPDEDLFRKTPRGTAFDHVLSELGLLLAGGREGGFFTMIGRRKP